MSSDRMIPMTGEDRSERAQLPLQRDHRLVSLSHDSNAMANFYSLMSVSTPCSTKADCCTTRDRYLGNRTRQFVDAQCESGECQWDVTPYPRNGTCE